MVDTNWQTSSTPQFTIACPSSEHPLEQEDKHVIPLAVPEAAPVIAAIVAIIPPGFPKFSKLSIFFNFVFFSGGTSREERSSGELGRFIPPPPEPEDDDLKQSLLLLLLFRVALLLLLLFDVTAAAAAAAAEADRIILSKACVEDISIKGNFSLSRSTGDGS